MRKSVFATLVFLCVSAGAAAQSFTVSGYVREEGSGEALMGAAVSDGPASGTAANQAGFWSLRLSSGEHTFKAAHIGYEEQSVVMDIRSDTTVNFLLGRVAYMLDEVVIKPMGQPVSVRNAGQIGVNISQVRNAPAFLGEPDIIKYLQIMPGVGSGKEGSSQLLVRGGSADQTLMMLDDIPIYNNNHAFGLVSVFNSDALSGAELYKGYVPAQYGGRLSSVASLRMRDGNRNRHTGSVTLGTLTLGGMIEGPIKKGKGSYIVSARRFTPDLLMRPAYAIIKPELRILYSFYDVNGKINYSLGERNRIYLSFFNGGDSFSNKTVEYENKKKVHSSGAGFNWGNTSASLKLETRAGKDIFISNSLYFSRVGNRYNTIYEDFKDGEKFKSRIYSNLYEAGLRTTVEQKAGQRHSLTYGLNASYQGFMPQRSVQTRSGIDLERTAPKRGLWTGTLFAGDHISLGRFSLDAGVRLSVFHNNNSRTEFGIEPRASVQMQVNTRNSASLSYTRSVQPLFSIEKPYMSFPVDFWLPYQTEKISSANQVSAGWINTSVKGLTLSLDAYYKNFNNLSLVTSPNDYLTGESEALPATGYAYGVEFLGVYARGRWSLSAAYTYSRSMRHALGQTFPFTYDIPHNANIYASYTTVQKKDRNHILSVNVNCHSGRPFVLSEGSFYIDPYEEKMGWGYYMEENPMFPNARLKPYFRTDVSYSMERKKKNGTRTWQVSILNATAYNNPYVVYNSSYKTKQAYKYITLIPFMPSFSYKRTF